MGLLIAYLICVVVCGVLHWAKYRDDNGYNYNTMQSKIIFLYLIPLIPIANIAAIVIIFMEYFDLI
jgi:hypothetical protein